MKYKKQSDGRFFASVWDGTYTPSGKKHYKRIVSNKSSKDLEAKVEDFKLAIRTGQVAIADDVTVNNYAELWLNTYKKSRSGNTVAMYRNIIDHHLCDIGQYQLGQIKRSTVQMLINERVDKARTCQQIMLTLKQLFKSAEKDRILPRGATDDVLGDITLPKYHATEKRPLTDYEIDAIKKADFTDRERAFVTLLYATGVRREEACALTIFDINFREKYIKIDKALAFVNNKEELKEPKSENGYRNVPMPDYLATLLKEYTKGLSSSYIFTMTNGERMTASGYKNMWAQIKKKLKQAYIDEQSKNKDFNIDLVNWNEVGFEDLTAHMFRHNYCTNLCYQTMAGTISIKRIAKLMGDSEEVVTKIYSHIIEHKEMVQEAIENAVAL